MKDGSRALCCAKPSRRRRGALDFATASVVPACVRCAPVFRRKPIVALGLVAVAGLAACGSKTIEVPKSQPGLRAGAVLFNMRCAGCHTFDAAATSGSKSKREIKGGERTNGPNFNVRHESKNDVLLAIRNGGFSGAIMPANVVVR